MPDHTFENGRPPTTVTGFPSTGLVFHARLRSPSMLSCISTYSAGPFSSGCVHFSLRRFRVRQVQASWLPSMTSFGIGASAICNESNTQPLAAAAAYELQACRV